MRPEDIAGAILPKARQIYGTLGKVATIDIEWMDGEVRHHVTAQLSAENVGSLIVRIHELDRVDREDSLGRYANMATGARLGTTDPGSIFDGIASR